MNQRDEVRLLTDFLQTMRDLRKFDLLRPGELHRVRKMLRSAGGRVPVAQRKDGRSSVRKALFKRALANGELTANGAAFSLRHPAEEQMKALSIARSLDSMTVPEFEKMHRARSLSFPGASHSAHTGEACEARMRLGDSCDRPATPSGSIYNIGTWIALGTCMSVAIGCILAIFFSNRAQQPAVWTLSFAGVALLFVALSAGIFVALAGVRSPVWWLLARCAEQRIPLDADFGPFARSDHDELSKAEPKGTGRVIESALLDLSSSMITDFSGLGENLRERLHHALYLAQRWGVQTFSFTLDVATGFEAQLRYIDAPAWRMQASDFSYLSEAVIEELIVYAYERKIAPARDASSLLPRSGQNE